MAPSADCSHRRNSICRVRLLAQSDLPVDDFGASAPTVDSAQAATGFWYPWWQAPSPIRQAQPPPGSAPPQA
jgi:hypothetical protein